MEENDLEMTQPQQPLDPKEQELQILRARIAQMEEQRKVKGKKWKRVLIVLGAILLILVLVGVAIFALSKTDKVSTAMAETVMEAIVSEDGSSAYALMYPGLISEAEFQEDFDEICVLWRTRGGGSAYTMKQTGWNMNIKNGIKQFTVYYTVTSGEAGFTLQLMRAEQGDLSGMVGVNLSVALPEGKPVRK